MNEGCGIVIGDNSFLEIQKHGKELSSVDRLFTAKQMEVYQKIKKSGKKNVALRGGYGTGKSLLLEECQLK